MLSYTDLIPPGHLPSRDRAYCSVPRRRQYRAHRGKRRQLHQVRGCARTSLERTSHRDRPLAFEFHRSRELRRYLSKYL